MGDFYNESGKDYKKQKAKKAQYQADYYSLCDAVINFLGSDIGNFDDCDIFAVNIFGTA
jgi:hypothetical protein